MMDPKTQQHCKKKNTPNDRLIICFYICAAAISSEVKAMATALAPSSSSLMQSLHGSLAMPGMHLTPVSGSTLHVFFAVMHKVEVGSLSQGPSSHILSIFVLSSSVHLPASTSASNV